jgi:hypothetical protein
MLQSMKQQVCYNLHQKYSTIKEATSSIPLLTEACVYCQVPNPVLLCRYNTPIAYSNLAQGTDFTSSFLCCPGR